MNLRPIDTNANDGPNRQHLPLVDRRRHTGTRGLGLVFLICATLGAACDVETQRKLGAAVSDAKPEIGGLEGEHDSRPVNNELDYGVMVTFTLTNRGATGLVQLTPWLSSSEGEWSRQQTVTVNAGQSLELSYVFHEPTINASNIQFGVRTTP